ncbi:MAG: type II secretion system F family protein, partial [Alphaproteobacteria bacterium]
MAAYEYEALDASGRLRKGVINADSLRMARKDLRSRKLVPVKLTESSEHRASVPGTGSFRLPRFGQRLAPRDLAMVTRQFATLINAAAPVEEALQAIALQADKPRVRSVLFAVRAGVTEGQRLSQAMAQQGSVFSPLYRSMVAAGEGSGTLGPVLERLADHLENGEKMRAKVTAALVYPAMLAIVAVGVVIMLMAFVVPKIVAQFDSMGRELPTLTKVMIALSDGIRDVGPFVLVALVLGGGGVCPGGCQGGVSSGGGPGGGRRA